MKVKATIDGKSLVENIRFHGETSSDEEVLKEIDALSHILEDVLVEITNVENQIESHRGLASAEKMKSRLDTLRSDLKEIYFEED